MVRWVQARGMSPRRLLLARSFWLPTAGAARLGDGEAVAQVTVASLPAEDGRRRRPPAGRWGPGTTRTWAGRSRHRWSGVRGTARRRPGHRPRAGRQGRALPPRRRRQDLEPHPARATVPTRGLWPAPRRLPRPPTDPSRRPIASPACPRRRWVMSHLSTVPLSALWCIDFGLRCGFASSPPAAIPACPARSGACREHAVSIFDLIGQLLTTAGRVVCSGPLRPAKVEWTRHGRRARRGPAGGVV